MAVLRNTISQEYMIDQFTEDVDRGLSSSPKSIPSKYFYDKKGDELFIQIMNLPEYYLTRAELEIFSEQTNELISGLGLEAEKYFELIELGPGDGTKTKELLRELVDLNYNFKYLPVDISSDSLKGLQQTVNSEMPDLRIHTQQGDYLEILESLKKSEHPKVLLFLGSNIGNLSDNEAAKFIYQLGSNLRRGDYLILGVDLIKPKEVILPAYNDKEGVTKAFNLNLLKRINRELGGNFDLDQFEHFPEYSEKEGIAKSYLKSKVNQEVVIENTGRTYNFFEGELIHTEISRKYDGSILEEIFKDTDFEKISVLTDSKNYFANIIYQRC